MTGIFVPVNTLEEKLFSLHKEEIEPSLFIQILLNSKIVIALDKDIDITQPNQGMNPLIIPSAQGYQLLTAFSSPGRVNVWFEKYPAYKNALLTDARWYLKGAAKDIGFALNPGWSHGIELTPDGLKKLKQDFTI